MKIKNIKGIAFLQNLTKAYTEGVYADTPANRKLGRVGMSYKQYVDKLANKNQSEQQSNPSQYSEETNSLIKKVTPYFEEIPNEIIETLLNKLPYLKNEDNIRNKFKSCLIKQNGGVDNGGVIFADKDGNFWDITSYNRTDGPHLRKLKEGVTKNVFQPSLQDALKKVGYNSKMYLDKVYSEGRGEEWIKNRLKNSKDLESDYSLAYMNKKQNSKEWDNVLKEVESLDKKTKEHFGIGSSKSYIGDDRRSLTPAYWMPNSKDSELGQFNNEDLKGLKNILSKIKNNNKNNNPFQ